MAYLEKTESGWRIAKVKGDHLSYVALVIVAK